LMKEIVRNPVVKSEGKKTKRKWLVMKRASMIGMLALAVMMGGVPLAAPVDAAPAIVQQEADYYYDLTPEEIAKRSGLPVLLPGYLPEGDYLLAGIVYHAKQQSVHLAFLGLDGVPFHMDIKKGGLVEESVGLNQTAFKKGVAYFGKAENTNQFIWEEAGGAVYKLSGSLPEEELKKVAESMGKGEYSLMKKATVLNDQAKILHPSKELASTLLGYSLKLPTVLPEGVELRIFSYTEFLGKKQISIVNKKTGPDIPDIFLYVHQGDVDEEMEGVLDVKKIPFGNGFAYTYQAPGSSANKPYLKERNGFVWSPDEGIIYTMQSDLPLEEIKKIAASVNSK